MGARLVVAAVVCAAAVGCAGNAHASIRDQRLQAVADRLVSSVFVGGGLFGGLQPFVVPGTVLTVQLPGQVARTFTAGVADLRTMRPIRASDPQPVGSGTKPMTAVVVLELLRRRRIGIDERLTTLAARYRRDRGSLARLVARHRQRLSGVTVRELLNMTSGLVDYDDDPAFGRAFAKAPRARRSLAQLASYGLARPRVFRPGAPRRTFYSNTNYILAAMLVEAVSGRSFASGIWALFRRAGMRSTSYPAEVGPGRVRGYQPPYAHGRSLPAVLHPFLGLPTINAVRASNAVLSVSRNPLGSGPTVGVAPASAALRARFGGTRAVPWQDVTDVSRLASIASAAGGAVATTADLARFWRALFSGRLLDRHTLRLMLSSVPAPPNPPGVRNYFALGPERQDVERNMLFPGSPPLRIWMKLGNIFGYSSASYYVEGPKPYGGVVVTNVINLFPTPVGDLGVLRDVLQALR